MSEQDYPGNAGHEETHGDDTTAALSVGQEQLWFLEQLEPGRPTYNVSVAHRLVGPLDLEALQASLTDVVREHEALRSTFDSGPAGPSARIAAAPQTVPLPCIDISGSAAQEREERAREQVDAFAAAPFDLVAGPLYRFTLFRLGPQEHILVQVYHHLVTDGWSATLVNTDLTAAYAARIGGAPLPAKAGGATLRYRDFAARQQAALRDGTLDEQLDYWEQQLRGLPVLDLPTDRLRPAEQSHVGAGLVADLPDDVLDAARALAAQEGVSLFMVLSAALAVVLARYTGQDDIALGTAALGRTDPALERVVGYFTNMVVLRVRADGDTAFADVLDHVADTVFEAFDHQDVPFERVVDRLRPTRDAGRNPLFGVSVQMLGDRNSAGGPALPGIEATPFDGSVLASRFDLSLTFVESARGVRLEVEYAADLFDAWRIEAFVGHFVQALAGACAEPSTPVSRIPLLDAAERERLLDLGRAPSPPYQREPLHQTIAHRAAERPDHPAAVFDGRRMTYGELDRRAGQLAAYLRREGIGRGQIVAMAMERDPEALVAMLGVMKAGAAYAPLDPRHPAGRLEFMLRDTAATLVLTQERVRARVPKSADWSTIALDTEWELVAQAAEDGAEPATDPDALAYLIYTSGSTGNPKAVLIEHRALQCFTESYRRLFDLGAEDRMLQRAALTFDMSQGEIFAGLSAGATIVQVHPEADESTGALAELMRAERVTYICLPPSVLAVLDAEPYPELAKIMVGGEALPAQIVNLWNTPGRRLINVYGPTEAAVGCTAYVCPHREWHSAPPIGRPLDERRVYVVDRHDNLVPAGVPGELLIGGDEGLARGYLNQPELTGARFVADPFHPGGRVYRSGDVVRWNGDGELEFLGRLDNQVKLRGLRIELEEIESALLAHPGVGTAAVAVRPGPGGDPRLVGYVTAAPGGALPQLAQLREHLAERLPEYMVPTAWVELDALPVTRSGKVDRATLPEPAPTDEDAGYAAPETETERLVAQHFAEVLEVERVSVDRPFFEIGGNSLQAMRVVSRLSQEFGVKVKLRSMFADATVRKVAQLVDGLLAAAGRGAGAAGAGADDAS